MNKHSYNQYLLSCYAYVVSDIVSGDPFSAFVFPKIFPSGFCSIISLSFRFFEFLEKKTRKRDAKTGFQKPGKAELIISRISDAEIDLYQAGRSFRRRFLPDLYKALLPQVFLKKASLILFNYSIK